jgi:hypothetical protein
MLFPNEVFSVTLVYFFLCMLLLLRGVGLACLICFGVSDKVPNHLNLFFSHDTCHVRNSINDTQS